MSQQESKAPVWQPTIVRTARRPARWPRRVQAHQVSQIAYAVKISVALTVFLGFETSRRAQTYGRRQEELHIPPNTAPAQSTPKELARHHSYHSSLEFSGVPAPGINVQQATPQGSHYADAQEAQSLPGSLQPGRPSASASITAPSTVPTLPQIQNSTQNQPHSSRPSMTSQAHSYSRSSPAGMDQTKYSPFVNTPESSKYASPPSHRYTSSQTQGDAGYSPLGLADIRPLTDSAVNDGPQSGNPYSNDGYPSFPTNSNYLAPWAVYAFDWCKWPVQQQSSGDSAGKMAIGSYVEDGHNFVSGQFCCSQEIGNLCHLFLIHIIDPNPRDSGCPRVRK